MIFLIEEYYLAYFSWPSEQRHVNLRRWAALPGLVRQENMSRQAKNMLSHVPSSTIFRILNYYYCY